MLNFGKGMHLPVMILPDGTIGQGDKQHLLDCYSGIDFEGAAVADTGRSLILQLGGG